MSNSETILKYRDFISPATGVSISFNIMRCGNKIEAYSLRSGGGITVSTLNDATRLHTHEFSEICIILKGKLRHLVNNVTDILEAGNIVFIRPSDVHCYQCLNDSTVCELVNVAFNLEYLVELSRYLEEQNMMKRFIHDVAPPVYYFSPGETEKLAVRLLTVNSLQITDIPAAKTSFKGILAELFIKTLLEQPPPSEHRSPPEWFLNLCKSLRTSSDLTNAEQLFKRHAPCSREHLCYCFKKYLETTPTAFLNDCRMIKAARMLLDGDATLYSISSDVGIKSLSRFHKLFQQKYGMTPGKFRKIHSSSNIPVT